MFKALDSVPLFKDVDEHILQLLEPLFEPYSCIAETVIFDQGDPALFIYLILAGTVEVKCLYQENNHGWIPESWRLVMNGLMTTQ